MKVLAAYPIAMVTAHAELLEHAMVELPALQRGAADAVVAALSMTLFVTIPQTSSAVAC